MLDYTKKQCDYLISVEIGGANSIIPLVLSLITGKPVIDGNFMGRAYPKLSLTTLALYDKQRPPYIIADDHKLVEIIEPGEINDYEADEFKLRTILSKMSYIAGIGLNLCNMDEIKTFGIKGSLTRCWILGRSVLKARKDKIDIIESINKSFDDKEGKSAMMFAKGRIIDFRRLVDGGYNMGYIIIKGEETDDTYCGMRTYKLKK